ncbi:hypothetical protein C0995_001747 [Termitomyces sp. Mi166|nr:hypothetical protein C0995_001747 [Termitomyces sp. Mi166\
MKLPSSSSFVAAALIASSSIPSLAAPANAPSKDRVVTSSGHQFVTSRSENIIPRAAAKDDVHKEDDGGKKGLLDDLVQTLLCLLKGCHNEPPKDKGPEHEKRYKKAARK